MYYTILAHLVWACLFDFNIQKRFYTKSEMNELKELNT